MINIKTEFEGIRIGMPQKTKQAQSVLVKEVLKDSNFYIPRDTGALETSSQIASNEKQLSWNTPYARRLYWNPQYNFSKDSNPNARGLWFEAAKAQKAQEWARKVAEAYR